MQNIVPILEIVGIQTQYIIYPYILKQIISQYSISLTLSHKNISQKKHITTIKYITIHKI